MAVALGTSPDHRPSLALRVCVNLPLLTCLLLMVVPSLPAAEPSPASAEDADWDFLTRDTYLMLKARRALLEDPDLAPLNLGVSVRGGAAVLWGTAPSQALARQAVEQLRLLPDLVAVWSELEVDSFLMAGDGPPPPPPLPQSQPPSSALAAAPRRQGPAPGALAGREVRGPPPAVAQPMSAVPAAPLNDSVSLLPPIPLTSPPPAVPQAVPSSNGPALIEQVEQLRRRDARFQQVRVQVTNRAVFLRGVVARGEDLMDLAQAISRLPGVERVVLENVQVAPR
jgi:hypothetical protein